MRFLDITKAQTIFFKLFEFFLNTNWHESTRKMLTCLLLVGKDSMLLLKWRNWANCEKILTNEKILKKCLQVQTKLSIFAGNFRNAWILHRKCNLRTMFLSSSLRMPGSYAPSSLAKFGKFVKNVNELIDFVKIPCRFKNNTLSLRRFSEKRGFFTGNAI